MAIKYGASLEKMALAPRLNYKLILLGMLVLYVPAVVSCVWFGKGTLREMCVSEDACDYLDLSRQSMQKRDYAQAEAMLHQAIVSAGAGGQVRPVQAVAYNDYSEFLRKRKRTTEADVYERRGKAVAAVCRQQGK